MLHNNNNILAKTLLWFQKAVLTPNSKNLHSQMGVHFEEVAEMLDRVTTKDPLTLILISDAAVALTALSMHLKNNDNVITITSEDRVEYLDALCDQIVTAVGCAHMSGMDVLGGMAEVNRSNFSKFNESEEPIFNADMKIMKGAFYTKADLKPFV